MAERKGWSREQLVIVLKLYCEMPFGKMHSRNPEIIRYANLIHRTPSALAMKLTNFASLDPEITSTGRKGLSGASRADKEIWDEMTSDWPRMAEEIAKVESDLAIDEARAAAVLEEEATSYVGYTRTAVIEARIGQDFFRKAVLSAYNFRCCITGLGIRELLVASHIAPWRTDKANRLNPRNGLCLSAVHDRAFDAGLLTLSDDFRVLLSPKLRRMKLDTFIKNTFHAYENRPINLPKKFTPDAVFLKHHREDVFHG
ncbi:MAG: HNH endonuclease [Terracidiphilus sp.]